MTHLPTRLRRSGAALTLAIVAAVAYARTLPPSTGSRAPATAPPRGAADPAQIRTMHGVVRPRETDEWTLRFVGGRPATVRVDGPDLRCAVWNPAGRLAAADSSPAGACLLRLVPSRTENYRVVIRNAGSSPAGYRLVVH